MEVERQRTEVAEGDLPTRTSKTGAQCKKALVVERWHLWALPAQLPATWRVVVRVADKFGHVRVEHVAYSAPIRHAYQSVSTVAEATALLGWRNTPASPIKSGSVYLRDTDDLPARQPAVHRAHRGRRPAACRLRAALIDSSALPLERRKSTGPTRSM